MPSIEIVQNAEKPQLIDCPFCGADGFYGTELWINYGSWGYEPPKARVVCSECGCTTDWRSADDSQTPYRVAVDLAVAAWNRRAKGETK